MNSREKKIYLGAIAFVLLAWLTSPLLLSRRETPPQPDTEPTVFDASGAFAATEEFVSRFPSRIFGSLESRPSTGYLSDRLQELGYSISYTHFDARIARRKKVGRNVLGYRQGQTDEILALAAHFDTAPTTTQGATANGSGVGALLELARVFSAVPTRRSLLIVFTDGGEYGSLGAKDIAAAYQGRGRIAAAISLDYVAPGDLAAFRLDTAGQMKGYAPPWLRELARSAAETQGLPVESPAGIGEHLERTLLISGADQGPFLAAGIPAVNLGSVSRDRTRQKALYHSPQDTIGNLGIAGMQKFGNAAERMVRTLDASPSIPRGSAGSFRLWDSRYWRPHAGTALHVLAFLPLAVAFWLLAKTHSGKLTAAGIRRELLACLGTAIPFWVFLLSISVARAMRLLPVYSLYPATAGDPVLLNPPWKILGGMLGAAGIAAVFCILVGVLALRDMPKPDFHASRLVLLALLLVIAALALARNSYWSVTFLLIPAWVWPLAGCGANLKERLRNTLWILLAAVPCLAVIWILSARLGLGWNFPWYQVLALASGLFTASGFYLAIACIALGIRFTVIQFRGNAA